MLDGYLQYSFQRGGEYQFPLAGRLPGRMCTFLLYFPILYVYSLMVETASW
jgi:hypothetical protein